MQIFEQLKKNDPHLRVITFSMILGMLTLLGGLWWVQVISYRHYSENLRAQSFRTVRIPAIRGKILDRHGAVLAENQPRYTVGLYLDELRELFRAEWQRSRPRRSLRRAERRRLEAEVRYRVVSNIVQRLSDTLQQPITVSFAEFMRHYTNQLALPLPLANPDPEIMARFFERTSSPRGLDLDMQPVRNYPHGSLAAHVLGFLVRDNRSAMDEAAFFNYRLPDYRGRVGIEGLFDATLRGRAGSKSVLVNSLGYRQSEQVWSEAEPGRNVVLTLDLVIQQAAESALQSHGPDTRGAVVVLDARQGDVLAMVSLPAYDPNRFVQGISHDYMTWLSDPVLRPQINRVMQENYAPGSIFKIVTSLACLESGLDPKRVIYNPSYIYVGRRLIDDTAPAGEYNFHRGFIRSSNTYFITNGLHAGIESIVRVGQRLHLGERTGLLPGQETGGFLPSLAMVRSGWVAGDTANICIGQGRLAVTPLQMALMTAAVANGGKVLWPRLVDRIEPQDLHTEAEVEHFPPRPPRGELQVDPAHLRIIREAMLADVEDKDEGTGRLAAVPGLRICGKTGTAQITNPRNQVIGLTLWFTSFAPYEHPRYVVLVMVESNGGGGGLVCAPIAQKIYRAIQSLESQRSPAVAGTQ